MENVTVTGPSGEAIYLAPDVTLQEARHGFENGMFLGMPTCLCRKQNIIGICYFLWSKMTARKQSCSNCRLSARILSEAIESDECRNGAKDNLSNCESKVSDVFVFDVQRFGVQKRLCCFDTSDLGHSMLTVGHHAAGARAQS